MKKTIKIILGLVLTPGFFCLYLLDRIYLIPLVHLTALPINLWYKKQNEITASIIRVLAISLFNLFIYWLI